MSRKRSPFGLLIIICLLISATVGMIQGRKKAPIPPRTNKEMQLSIQDTIDLITPLLLSKSFDAVAQALHQFDQSVIVGTVEKISADSGYDLNSQERAQLLLNLIEHIPDKIISKKIFSVLKENHAQDPIYSYALLEKVPHAIKLIHKWAKKSDKSVDEVWAQQSLSYAIERNEVELLDQLYAHNVRSTPQFASQLLHNVVSQDGDVAFVPLLVRTMDADPNFSPDGKSIILIKAVEQQNEPMVRALLEAEADPEKMVDEKVGTARQIAFEKGLVSIEALLRKEKRKRTPSRKSIVVPDAFLDKAAAAA